MPESGTVTVQPNHPTFDVADRYKHVLEIVRRRDRSLWTLGAALIVACGPPGESHVKDGSHDRLAECAAFLHAEGFGDYNATYLRQIRSVAYAFDGGARASPSISWAAHREAGKPEIMQEIVRQASPDARITVEHIRLHKVDAVKALLAANAKLAKAEVPGPHPRSSSLLKGAAMIIRHLLDRVIGAVVKRAARMSEHEAAAVEAELDASIQRFSEAKKILRELRAVNSVRTLVRPPPMFDT
jgi:hypothetical protein